MKAAFYVISVILFFGLVLLMVVFAGTKIEIFISLPALLVVLLPSVFILVPVYSIPGFGKNIGMAFNEKGSAAELKQALQFIRHLSMCLYFSAIVGVLMGLIGMLANIMDQSAIGCGLSVALISPLYVFIIHIFLILPIRASLKKKSAELE